MESVLKKTDLGKSRGSWLLYSPIPAIGKWSEVKVAQSCPTLCVQYMCCSLPGSSVHGILQARILERVAVPFSRGSSQPRDQNPSLPHCRQTPHLLSHQGSTSSSGEREPKNKWWKPKMVMGWERRVNQREINRDNLATGHWPCAKGTGQDQRFGPE